MALEYLTIHVFNVRMDWINQHQVCVTSNAYLRNILVIKHVKTVHQTVKVVIKMDAINVMILILLIVILQNVHHVVQIV